MSTIQAPEFRVLSHEETAAILRRNHVGRVAYTYRDRVDIQPIHYVFSGGWIYGRTAPGTKLSAIRHNYWVAFEVDEVDGIFAWRSVVVHGGFYLLSSEGPAEERATWHRAVDLIRRVVPETFADDDPVPFRNVIFRIAVQEASGREARPGAAGSGH